MYFDSHTHLNAKQLLDSLDNVLARAHKVGIVKMIVPSYDLPSVYNAISLSKQNTGIYAAIGIHPTDAKNYDVSILETLKELVINNQEVKAIGEIGLDYYWDKSEDQRLFQQEMFIRQIELANSLSLPVIIHMRDASEDTLKIIREHLPKFGFVMHCFSGSKELMFALIELGAFISFGGPVTFTNAVTPKECVGLVPLNRLLIETDAPYLAPHPLRGKLNEPSNLVLINKQIALLRNMSEEELATITFNNACDFFHVEKR